MIGLSKLSSCLSLHGGVLIISKVFIARLLARDSDALIGARRCSSPKRRAALTSMADSDPGPARPGPPGSESLSEHNLNLNKLLRTGIQVTRDSDNFNRDLKFNLP